MVLLFENNVNKLSFFSDIWGFSFPLKSNKDYNILNIFVINIFFVKVNRFFLFFKLPKLVYSDFLKIDGFWFVLLTCGFGGAKDFLESGEVISRITLFFGSFGVVSSYINSIVYQEGNFIINLKSVWVLPQLFEICKNSMFLDLNLLSDVWGEDLSLLNRRQTGFAVTYNTVSVKYTSRLYFKIFMQGNAAFVPSIQEVFKNSCWLEREVWDMFGIIFCGNTDLRRILTDYGFLGHPLKKNFPLTGFVELRYNDALHRIVFEPLELAQDLRFFEFSNPWNLESSHKGSVFLDNIVSYNSFLTEYSAEELLWKKIYIQKMQNSLSVTNQFDIFLAKLSVKKDQVISIEKILNLIVLSRVLSGMFTSFNVNKDFKLTTKSLLTRTGCFSMFVRVLQGRMFSSLVKSFSLNVFDSFFFFEGLFSKLSDQFKSSFWVNWCHILI